MHSLGPMDTHDIDDHMPFLAQELVDAILAEVDDLASLKACSLVEPRFRVPSQRILLCSVTLSGCNPESGWSSGNDCLAENFGAARTLLEESPQVSAYITTLQLRLHLPVLDTESLEWVLRQLVNVRRLILGGLCGRLDWNRLPSTLTEAVVDLMSRQQLHHLRVHRVTDIPGEILLTAARSLSVLRVTVQNGVLDPSKSDVTPIVQDLVLLSGSDGVFTKLSYPQFRPYITALRRFSFISQYGRTPIVLGPAADTLEHIHIRQLIGHIASDRSQMTGSISLPTLRALRTIEFEISLRRTQVPFILDTISALLHSHASPFLTEIVLTFPIMRHLFTGDSMIALDRAIVAHPAAPRIRWRMSFRFGSGAALFAQFGELLRMGLPETHALGRLLVEDGTDRKGWY
ncbi:hypothetical protein C8R45DRAFT_928000 [Mycena sanguinolenta]|nr:hypothetical protein C8R45DRAFT_928000 [Mycena sanguinolenta]